MININNPTTPRVDTVCFGAEEAHGIYVMNNHAYLADNLAGLKLIDISIINQPIDVGTYDTTGMRPYRFYAIWARDTLGYIGSDLNFFPPQQFAVVNIKYPSNIS